MRKPTQPGEQLEFGLAEFIVIPSFLVFFFSPFFYLAFLDDVLGFLSIRQRDSFLCNDSPLLADPARSLGRNGVLFASFAPSADAWYRFVIPYCLVLLSSLRENDGTTL